MVQHTEIKRKVAKLFDNGGSQAVRLPAEFRFDADEVYATRDETTGEVTLSTRLPKSVWQDMFDYMDSLEIPQEDLDEYMAERPMNLVVFRPGVFDDEE